MKHHKLFRTALIVSIQERRELFPELIDHDVVKALQIIAEDFQRKITVAERQRKARELHDWHIEYERRRKEREQQDPEEVRAQHEADRQRLDAEARQRAAQWAAESLRRSEQLHKEAQERQAQRELSLRIVDMSYKALAKELHPDKGGSQEAMARLNRARDYLKRMCGVK